MTLEESVNKAVETVVSEPVIAENTGDKNTFSGARQRASKPEPDKPTETAPTPTPEPRQLTAAEKLFADVNSSDPRVRNATIKMLAEQAELIVEEKKVTPAVATKRFGQRLLARIPENERPFFASLLPALELTMEEEIQARVAPVQQEILNDRMSQAEREAASDVEKFYLRHEKNHPEIRTDMNFQAAMIAKTAQMPPGQGVDYQSYLDDIYSLVHKDHKVANQVAKTVERINKNAKEATPASSEVQETRTRVGSALPSLKEAVAAAARGERFK